MARTGWQRAGMALAALLLVAACQPDTGGQAASEKDSCNASAFAHLVGAPVAEAQAVPEPKRIIRPGDMVTKDYRPDRTNVYLDATDRIEDLSCG